MGNTIPGGSLFLCWKVQFPAANIDFRKDFFII